jgi:putative transcriptional regulator
VIKTKRDTERDASHMTRGRRSRHLGRIALLCVLALVMTGVSTAGFAYLRIVGNVKETDVRKYLKNRPTLPKGKAGKALNILILGSDIRTGKSDVDGAGASGDVDGMRADTTMIMHISADRKRVYFVSIPRDTVVDIPSCVVQSADKKKTENSEPVEKTKFNSAFAIGGKEGYVPTAAACSMKTVEALTKVRLSGYVVVNFASFKSIVDELGGIPMYFPEARKDSASGLNVPAGCRLLRGDQALALARARKSIGDGSDIGRISRQQDLVKAIVKEAKSLNLFTNFKSLMRVLNAVTKNIETSSGYGGIGGITDVGELISSLGDIDSPTFITMPWESAGARVKVRQGAERLWKALANDTPIDFKVDANGQIVDDKTGSASPSSASPSAKSQPAANEQQKPSGKQSRKPSAGQQDDKFSDPDGHSRKPSKRAKKSAAEADQGAYGQADATVKTAGKLTPMAPDAQNCTKKNAEG